jgi:hypothetical protein
MKTSLIKLTLGSLAALAFAIAPAQGAPLLINTLQDQGGTPLAPYQAQAWDYGTWSGNTWNSWGLGVTGNATVSGGATFTPVTLNLSSYGQVQIEAQALAGNAATGFNVNFFTDGSNYNVYRFNIAAAPAGWTTVTVDFSSPLEVYGAINWGSITSYELQGTFAGTDSMQMQFRNLQVQAVPEPATWALMGIAGTGLMVVRRIRSRRES